MELWNSNKQILIWFLANKNAPCKNPRMLVFPMRRKRNEKNDIFPFSQPFIANFYLSTTSFEWKNYKLKAFRYISE